MTASTELETIVSKLNNGSIDADAFAIQARDIFTKLGKVSDAEKIAAYDEMVAFMVAFIQDNYCDQPDEVDGKTYTDEVYAFDEWPDRFWW